MSAAATWVYQAPFRPNGHPSQCYYRTDASSGHDVRIHGGGAETPSLQVFRWSDKTCADIKVVVSNASLDVRLDRAALVALRDALNDAMQDIEAVEAERERRESFEATDQVAAKVQELEAADAKQYRVVPEAASRPATPERPADGQEAEAEEAVQCAQLRSGQTERFDWWSGSAAALMAKGVVAMESLPGQPGRNKCAVTIRPSAGRQGAPNLQCTPGYTQIYRSGSGFRVQITVALDEQARRRDAAKRVIDGEKELNASALSDWESHPFDAAAERAAGVQIEATHGGELTIGTREQLLSTGRCREDFFPEGRQRFRCTPGPLKLWSMSRQAGGLFVFHERLRAAARARRTAARNCAVVQPGRDGTATPQDGTPRSSRAGAPHLRLERASGQLIDQRADAIQSAGRVPQLRLVRASAGQGVTQ